MIKTVTFMFLIGTLAQAQTRIIPHLTRVGGGFETQIILENTSTTTQPYQFNTYDTQGNPVGISSGIMLASTTSSVAPETFFGSNDVSHFTIDASSGISVAVAYRAIDGPGSPAHVRESTLQASTWRIYAGDWNLIFDGFAVINTGTQPTDITVVQLDESARVIDQIQARASLDPMAKALFVLGDAFDIMEDVYYEVRATQPIAITSLRGTPPSSDVGYLWENSAAQFETAGNPADARIEFPFWETIDTGAEGFRITQQGSGMAARMEIDNPNSSNAALYLTHNGSGSALSATQWSTGRAALFQHNQQDADQPTVEIGHAGRGAGLLARQTGTGSSAIFETTESSNSSVTLAAENHGQNATAWFHTRNATNTQPALWAGTDNFDTGSAAYFSGHVHVSGTLSKSNGSFKIDHPEDPANRTLSHSFVESPDMMNVYNGNIELNAEGEAWIELPAYFDSLNRDFRYQLTPIGAPASLYIAKEIDTTRFKIAGGSPGLKVSWQVTGIRDDAYARAYPIVVEEEKPEHAKGTYLNPEVFESSEERF